MLRTALVLGLVAAATSACAANTAVDGANKNVQTCARPSPV
jgi:hypothetical protein